MLINAYKQVSVEESEIVSPTPVKMFPVLHSGSQILCVISPTVLPPSADCRQQQPASHCLSVMETDNSLDMCFSLQQEDCFISSHFTPTPHFFAEKEGKKLPGGTDSLFFLPISHNEVVPRGISRAECY